jgi:type IV secretion system protein VirB2
MSRIVSAVNNVAVRGLVAAQMVKMPKAKATGGRMSRVRKVAAGFALSLGLVPVAANAATAGGGMPWDGPLNTIVTNLTGPVATAVAVGAFFVAGAILVFGEDMSAFVRRLLMAVIAVSLLVFGTKILSALGITNGAIV